MKTVQFNVNRTVKVKLTEYGRECLRRNYDELSAGYNGKLKWEFELPKEDAEGWSKWQMHSLMEQLGRYMRLGCACPFDPNIRIEIEDDPIQSQQPKEIHHHHYHTVIPASPVGPFTTPGPPTTPWTVTCKSP